MNTPLTRRERLEQIAFTVLIACAWAGVIVCGAKMLWLVSRPVQ